MEFLNNWWIALPIFEKVMWCFAVPSSLLAIIQVVLEFIGAGDTDVDMDGFDSDFDSDTATAASSGLHLFTFKGIVIFFTAFSWLGLGVYNSNQNAILALFVGTVAGVICMFFFAWIFMILHGLAEAGNFKMKSVIGKQGKVYLKIPGQREKTGKVIINTGGKSVELAALTDGPEIATGASIMVSELVDDQTVLVSKS